MTFDQIKKIAKQKRQYFLELSDDQSKVTQALIRARFALESDEGNIIELIKKSENINHELEQVLSDMETFWPTFISAKQEAEKSN